MLRHERRKTPASNPTSLQKGAVVPWSPLSPVSSSRSPIYRKVLADVAKFARHESVTIVFEGETGTGKNWLARLAHRQSPRHAKTMHTISLAELSDSLIASELFGHEQGAYTDAHQKRVGAFQTAHQSTLFIDEIGKASIAVQNHLLRVVDEHELTSVGADRPIKVDVRLLAASNVSLPLLVKTGHFLRDLYARLGRFRVHVPALRERREDIPDLARFFLAKYAAQLGYPAGLPTIHPALVSALQRAHWEFNLRDLESAMLRLLVEADSEVELTLDHCVGDLAALRPRTCGRPRRISSESVQAAILRSKSKSSAARDLDISRSTLYRSLRRADSGKSPTLSHANDADIIGTVLSADGTDSAAVTGHLK